VRLNPVALTVWIFGGSLGTFIGCLIESDPSWPLLLGSLGVAIATLWSLSQPSQVP
jgi:hypothetical protein